jgi:hypothetical protein
MNETVLTLAGLSINLRLSEHWLRGEAEAGRIPCLKVGRKLLFNQRAVESALAERAGHERITAMRASPAPS